MLLDYVTSETNRYLKLCMGWICDVRELERMLIYTNFLIPMWCHAV